MIEMNTINIKTSEIQILFAQIGLANKNGEDYKERLKKHKQIYDYLLHLNKAIKSLSKKREIILVDCACGKSYLSFVANYYFTQIEKRKVRFICIDYNEHVTDSSKTAAEELGFDNMEFICDDILS